MKNYCNHGNWETHHIFFGAGQRELSDYYGLVIGLCQKCHGEAHGKFENHKEFKDNYKEFYQEKYCDFLEIPYVMIKDIMKKNRRDWITSEHRFMRGIKLKLK